MPDQQYDGVILEDKWGKTYLCSSCLFAYADLGDDIVTDVLDKEYGRYFLHALEPYWNLRQIWLEIYQHAKPWAYDFSRFTDFQLRDALLQLFAAGELRIWQLTEGWGQPPEGNGIGEGGLVMTGSSAAPGTTYKKVLQPGGAADTESIGVVDAAIGVADLMATGLVNTGVDIVAGGASLVTLAISGGDVDAAVYTMESVQENQVGPFTQAGEDVAKVVAPVVDKYYEQNMAAIGEKTLEVTDSPMLAMAAHKSVELVGTVMGAGVVGNAVKRAAKVDVPESVTLRQTGGGGFIDPADELYDAIRASSTDIGTIANNTGIKPQNIQKVKDHVFYNEHLLDKYVDYGIPAERARFDSDLNQAQAWQRLENGTYTDADITWLKHETAERWYELRHSSGYTDAHTAAERKWTGNPWGRN